ncbi:MAG: hypothetical protein ABSE41_10380 [Bacteroidota bacterium]|jgi:hypothetical protein
MDLESEIFNVRLKRDTVRVARWIGSDPKRFRQLMALFLHGEYRVAQQSAWILGVCYDQYPWLITPWLPAMVKRMQEPDVHDGVIRNAVRILQCVEIPKALLGTVVSLCFDFINSYDTPIAVKAYSMTVLANAAEREPALRRELKASLELLLPSKSPGIQSHTRMTMKRLEKMEKQEPGASKRNRI